MVAWHGVIADTAGNPLGALINATQRQANFYLYDACTASFTMNGTDPIAALIQETLTDGLLYRNNTLMFRGRFGASQDTIGSPGSNSPGGTDPTAHTVNFSALDYRGMLGYRLIPNPVTYTNVDQATIAWNLINTSQAQQGGNWGITRGLWTPSTVRTLAFVGGAYVEQSIDDTATLDAGFDWEISPTLKFNSWPVPSQNIYTGLGRGQNLGVILTYGDNVSDVQRSLDTTQYANVIRYSANYSTGSTQTDIVASAIYGGAFGPAGRWEHQDSNNNITDATTLQNAATAELVKMAVLVPSYQLTLTRGWWDPTQLWLGDLVTVNVVHGRLKDQFQGRVTEVDIYIGDDASEETVVVSVGPEPGSLLKRILKNEKKLVQISKSAN